MRLAILVLATIGLAACGEQGLTERQREQVYDIAADPDEFDRLRARVDELEARVEELENRGY